MLLETQDALYVALELVIAALSVAGNMLVCAAVGTASALQTPTNYFLVSLAAADVAVGLFAIPFAITISLGFCTDFYGCLFLACFVLVLTQSSIFSLLAVAVDRYLAVCVPLRSSSASSCLVSGLAASLPLCPERLCIAKGRGENTEARPILPSWPGHRAWRSGKGAQGAPRSLPQRWSSDPAIAPPTLVGGRGELGPPGLPSGGLVLAAGLPSAGLTVPGPLTTLQREIHAAKSLAMIVGIFALCWLPVHAVNCVTLFQPAQGKNKPKWAMNMAILLSHANSVVNPIVYAYRNQDFRYTFHKIISRYLLCQTDVKSGNGQAGAQPALGVGL
nr:adenosine receptor A2b [Aotus nancymaae]